MSEDQSSAEESGIFELAPEEAVGPVKRWVSPSEVAKQNEPLPCPECKYDLRGLRADRCPECGTVLTQAAVRQAKNIRDGVNDSNWYDRRAVLSALVGLVLGSLVWGLTEGSMVGVIHFLMYLGVTVVIGWVVFFACSVVWIGFDQPLPKTIVQTIGAYGLYSGIAAVLMLVPVPGFVMFFVGMVVLVSLLSEMLDIDLQDAIYVAVIVLVVQNVLVAFISLLSIR